MLNQTVHGVPQGLPPAYSTGGWTRTSAPTAHGASRATSSATPKTNHDRRNNIIVGVALTVIAGVAAVLCLVYGLTLYDTAMSSLATFGAGFLIYSGVTFTIVAVGNALLTGYKQVSYDEDSNQPFSYTNNEMKYQITASVLAPVAAIPIIVVAGLCAAIGGR